MKLVTLLAVLAGILGLLLAGVITLEPERIGGAAPFNPDVRITLDSEPFSGGLVVVEEAAGAAEDIDYVDVFYSAGVDWVHLGRDYGYPMDSDEKTGQFAVWWDIEGLESGEYLLRAEMHTFSGGYGEGTIEVSVSPEPVGRVAVLPTAEGAVVLSAEEFFDPAGTELVHEWRFGSGAESTDAVVEVAYDIEDLPIVFSHTVWNAWGAASSDVYLLQGGALLSLVDHQVGVTLGAWIANLRDIVDEKETLKAGMTPENRGRIDRANGKLESAAEKIEEAKRFLKATPPDEAGAKRALQDAKRLIKEAIAELEGVTEQEEEIADNISKLEELLNTIPLAHLETEYLLDRTEELRAVIREKKALAGLPPDVKQIVDDAVTLLEDAKKLLDEAKAGLFATPIDLGTARKKIDEARAKVKEAGGKLEGIPAPRPQEIDANIEKLKQLFLRLGLLSGKVWLLERIGIDSPHAGISIPNLTRKHLPHYDPVKEDVEMGTRTDPFDDNGWDSDLLYHELDHHILRQKNKQTLEGGHHWYDEDLARAKPSGSNQPRGEERGRRLAWSEGWANFSSCAKRGDPHYLDQGEAGRPRDHHFTHEKDLERDSCRNTGDNAMHPNANKGPAVEGSVSGILWDLFDGAANGVADQDADGVSIGFEWIWLAINEKPHPENILDFYKNLEKVLRRENVPYDQAKLDKIFENHGVTPP